MDFRPDRARAHDADRIRDGSSSDALVAHVAARSVVVRAAVWRRLSRLGRDFFAFPFDAHGHLWRQTCDRQLRVPVLCARYRLDPGRTGGCATPPAYGRLGRGVRYGYRIG